MSTRAYIHKSAGRGLIGINLFETSLKVIDDIIMPRSGGIVEML